MEQTELTVDALTNILTANRINVGASQFEKVININDFIMNDAHINMQAFFSMELNNVTFRNCTFNVVTTENCLLKNVKFDNCTFKISIVEGCTLDDVVFIAGNITISTLIDCNILSLMLSNVKGSFTIQKKLNK